MRKTIFTLIAGTALTAGLLFASCHGKVTISGDNGTDTLEFNTDSIREININVKTNEEGEADGTEAMGLALYEAEAMDISELPETAKKQDRQGKLVLYVNIEQAPTEDEPAGIYSVWMADEKAGKVCKILTTNPTAGSLWDQMKEKDSNAAPTEMHLIATAEKAFFASKDGSKIIVEGCPDARNTWTYTIDTQKRTVKQFPCTEGVQSIDLEKGEVILASYGYYPAPDYGRYSVTNAYTIDGKFLRQASESEAE